MAYRRGRPNKAPVPKDGGQRVQPDDAESRPANLANARSAPSGPRGRGRGRGGRGGFKGHENGGYNGRDAGKGRDNEASTRSMLNPQSSIWVPRSGNTTPQPENSTDDAANDEAVPRPASGHAVEGNGNGSAVQNDFSRGVSPDTTSSHAAHSDFGSNGAQSGYNTQGIANYNVAQDNQGSAPQSIPYDIAPQGNFTNTMQNGMHTHNDSTFGNNGSVAHRDASGNTIQGNTGCTTNNDGHGDLMKHRAHSNAAQNTINGNLTKARAHTIATAGDAEPKTAGFDQMTFELLNKTLRDSDGRSTGAP
ncbi:Uncharacterized protein TPAR_04749 [Tolypocladium paradoxum]|uniref:Uncharacterized protein n=1 Tax=Tolypocladium paradoxum TaxID=94208 RepID=A0A2S4KY15_9HYPO|nr:Uncharacterized protein TPAR_04749 [Tolypocladium paradoxum]